MSVRVLHVTECYAGGVSRAIETLVRMTPSVEHHLLHSGDEEPDPSHYATVSALPRSLPSAMRAVQRVAGSLRVDTIHAHSSWAGVFSRARRPSVPVIYQPHCYKFDDTGLNPMLRTAFRVAERILAKRSHRTVVLSPHEEELARSLDARAHTHFLPNVASIRPDESHRAASFEPGDEVIMIGRLSPQKDPDFFAQVANMVRAERPDVGFTWVGDGDAKMRSRLKASGVNVTGWLPREEMLARLSKPALYLHSARYEGFPLSVLDAAEFEHPIVARAIPAFDGLGVPTAVAAGEVAGLVLDALRGGAAYSEAVLAAEGLRESMNPAAQAESLLSLYDSIGR
ncbi:MAG: hypothetical protein K0S70_694 [Microbacterium sp.]|jgi:glycosyltransferase involved in cell wall biosynthesis|nr:hypothetical protein [Microbacterium sp.]